ncbi:flagellar transcriptional regulator FlhD [Thauera aromatica]|uniref:flagellar transcriptional regulator FlhD n=1 Tax=Thauera aromatica TaxID=59405 RepID=UPI001FFCD74E|nr:flagellar transcriptional regulator FlhD [Thauera aromatica]MCK2097090.1 flagellar transcriptional regulator FlhD [Thauera aromatica]
MKNEAFGEEVEELNLLYLMLAQRMLTQDRASAKFRLKIDDAVADVLLSLKPRQVRQLAACNQLLCRLVFDGAERFKALVENRRLEGLTGLHAAIVLASEGEDDAQ